MCWNSKKQKTVALTRKAAEQPVLTDGSSTSSSGQSLPLLGLYATTTTIAALAASAQAAISLNLLIIELIAVQGTLTSCDNIRAIHRSVSITVVLNTSIYIIIFEAT